MQDKLKKILPKVNKPARYVDGEWNAVHKNWDSCRVKAALVFPDVYEVGMSHLGLKILYHLVNSYDDLLAERVYAPWPDMEKEMLKEGVLLYSLESKKPVREFDFVGFTLQYEMSYTNILNCLSLAGIPLWSQERNESMPLIIAGGPGAFHPEPLADFIDLFLIGDGEESLAALFCLKKEHPDWSKEEILRAASQMEGVYVPQFYEAFYDAYGNFLKLEPKADYVPYPIKRSIVSDLNEAYYPESFVVPSTEVVHDRITLEVQRGCSRGCRFCQAGIIYRPVRERKPEKLLQLADQLVKNTGYNEISLSSLSTSDYSCLPQLVEGLLTEYKEDRIGVSLPSLRIDSFSVDLAQKVQEVRKTGLTFAPEAGTQRLRNVINKGVTEEDLLRAAESAFRSGWLKLKLYFMIGLPTETDADLDGIADLAHQVAALGERIRREKKLKIPVKITVSTSCFVPKPDTPFQWVPQVSLEEFSRKQKYLMARLRSKNIVYNWHEGNLSFLEAVIAKGDRRLSQVLYRAWELGCKFDSWQEHFKYEAWMQAFCDTGIEPERFAYRELQLNDPLPWDHIDCGVSKNFLAREYRKSLTGELTPDCRINQKCTGCGICIQRQVKVDLAGGETVDALQN